MATSFDDLSQELIDEVIDRLAILDLDSLSSHSLISRSFQHRTQFHIFYTFHCGLLGSGPDGEARRTQKLQRLHEVLQDRPILAKYPHRLMLSPFFSDSTWIHENQTFLEIIGMLENLSKVVVHGAGAHNASFKDNQAFLDIFWGPLIQPRLKSLTLKSVSEAPLEMVMSCPHLTTLNLGTTSFKLCSQKVPMNPLKLHILGCSWSPEALKLLTSWQDENGIPLLDLSSLTCFSYVGNIGFSGHAEDFVHEYGSHILSEAVSSLRIFSFSGKLGPIVDLGPLRRLHTLKFTFPLSPFAPQNLAHDPIATLVATLESVPRGSALRCLNVVVNLQISHKPDTIEWLHERSWSSFDQAVARWQERAGARIEINFDFPRVWFNGTAKDDEVIYVQYKEGMAAYRTEKFPISSSHPLITFTHTYKLHRTKEV